MQIHFGFFTVHIFIQGFLPHTFMLAFFKGIFIRYSLSNFPLFQQYICKFPTFLNKSLGRSMISLFLIYWKMSMCAFCSYFEYFSLIYLLWYCIMVWLLEIYLSFLGFTELFFQNILPYWGKNKQIFILIFYHYSKKKSTDKILSQPSSSEKLPCVWEEFRNLQTNITHTERKKP